MQHLADKITHSSNIELLGTDACRDQAVPFDVGADLPARTRRRLERALRLGDALKEVLLLAPPAGAKQACFDVAHCIVAHALDFDATVLSPGTLLPHAGAIDEVVLDIVALSMDTTRQDFSEDQLAQLTLPTRCGGLQVDLPTRLAPLARAARLIEDGPRLRAAIAAWEPEPGQQLDPHHLDGVAAEAEDLRDCLSQLGIAALGSTGEPASAPEPWPEDPFRPSAPPRHLLSAYLRHVSEQRYRELMARATSEDAIRLLSTGGPTAGASLTAPLCFAGARFSDRQWSAACRWRLGLPEPGPLGCCKNQASGEGEACGEQLDSHGDHAVDCPRGPLRNFRHNDIADVYADIVDEAGAIARREVYVPELSGAREAWLDVWAYGIPECPDMLLDITVRHPRADRYRPASEKTAGAACVRAAEDKHGRYGAAGGREIWPVAHETWGRLGTEAEHLLAVCAAAAARRAYRRGQLTGGCLRRWRVQLDGALQRGIAAQLFSARHGLPGRKARRR